jgi:hypothetical protein
MRARRAGALALALASLAAVPGVAGSATPPPAVLPSELQALLLKTSQLQVSSERFVHTIAGSSAFRAHFVFVERGEVDLSAGAAALSIGPATRTRPVVIAVGAFAYVNRRGAGVPRDRPWVRERLGVALERSTIADLFPFHEVPAGVPSRGGTGPYAALLDLLAEANGQVRSVGQANVGGQPTSEFEAILPAERPSQSSGASTKAGPAAQQPSSTLRIFLDPSGLPLRVIKSFRSTAIKLSDTTDIAGVNIPLDIKPPPPGRTISRARYRKLTGKGKERNESSSSSHTEATAPPPK